MHEIIFPEQIGLETATLLSQQMEKTGFQEPSVFDLSGTISIHSAFIGFLILAKCFHENHGASLTLKISPHVHRVFEMLNLISFFFPHSSDLKKSA